ncbi:hypothetical protein [Achromobacter sp. Bel]|uniref:hypothetical protein n=1 Tax=Achromobacter sp. Bel TaxID=2727415 RepID=UPI00145EFE5F|nr:hypothetical protein [Achromobacter sp. Bel]NMK47271.1 hypothetical protein [Achromobacter sp. Bel]
MSEDRVLSYLSGQLDDNARRAFEADMARDPALRAEVDEWRNLAQARQLAHNDIGRADRDSAFLRALAERPPPAQPLPTRARRLWQWLWPTPASPLMPLGWALAIMLSVMVVQQAPLDAPAPDGVLTRGGGSCPRLVVDLPDALTAKQLRNTLSQYDVSIVDGPDADGRYVLSAARESSLQDAAHALGVLSATPGPAGVCPRQ